MGEQSQEIRRLREDIATSKRQDGDADSNDGGPQAVTLLVGNSLLCDVRVDKTPSGNPIKIRRKSGATFADIEQMIDDATKTETIDEIFIVGGTHERTSDVSAANIKENIAQLLRKAKTLTPTITVEASSQSRSTGGRQHENKGNVQRSRRQIRRQRRKCHIPERGC